MRTKMTTTHDLPDLPTPLSTTPAADEGVSKAYYPLTELGVTGLQQSSGYILEEYQPELQGTKALRIYREMSLSDDTVGAVLFAIDMTIRSVPWEVVVDTENKGSVEHEEKATFVRDMLFKDMDHPWEDFLIECLSMIVYGFALFEIVLKRRMGLNSKDKRFRSYYNDGLIGIKRLGIRSQDSISRWEFQDDELVGAWQRPPYKPGEIYLPMERLALFRSRTSKNNPEGQSALRTAYKSYHYKKNIETFEAIGIERELNGLPMITIPDSVMKSTRDADKAVIASYLNLIKNIRLNHQAGVILPSDPWKDEDGKISSFKRVNLELLSAKGTRAIDTTKVLDRYAKGIARACLADWVMLGVGERGSQALSRDKSSIWMNALEGWLNIIAAEINRCVIPIVWEANGWDIDTMPKIQYGKVDVENIQELADSLLKLSQAGMRLFPDDDLEKHVRERAGFPDINPDAEYQTQMDLEEEKLDVTRKLKTAFGKPNGNSDEE